jgi:glycosyltransferase involved in cell wall biosynthesis
MLIVGALRVKNEARWIAESLASISPLCEQILVLDDHSTDNTIEICESFQNVQVLRSPFNGLDESRDKNHLMEYVDERLPDWVCMIDGDEVLEPGGAEAVLETIKRNPSVTCIAPKIAYLWDSPNQVRVDGIYSKFYRASMFVWSPGLRFKSTSNGGNFHCGNTPSRFNVSVRSQIQLLHYGYMEREDRIRKYEWYNARDPHNRAEDEYRHMVIGDVFPVESVFKHAGPLELRPI